MTTMVLARNEWLKTTRRLAFWITLLCLAGLMGIVFWDRHSTGVNSAKVAPFTLPDGWRYILSEAGPMPAMFGAVLIIMLVASEFSWRTARQNVIDGLSRGQFFAGKTLLLPAVAVATLLPVVLVGATVALLDTAPSALAGALPGQEDLAFAGGDLLAVGVMAAMALLLATTVRSSGPAMALYFFYIAFGERILAGAAARLIPAAAALGPYWPWQVVSRLTEEGTYYAPVRQAAVEEAATKGAAAPTFIDPAVLSAVAVAWILVFALGGYLAFRRRDL